jgi:hypothetical protein
MHRLILTARRVFKNWHPSFFALKEGLFLYNIKDKLRLQNAVYRSHILAIKGRFFWKGPTLLITKGSDP